MSRPSRKTNRWCPMIALAAFLALLLAMLAPAGVAASGSPPTYPGLPQLGGPPGPGDSGDPDEFGIYARSRTHRPAVDPVAPIAETPHEKEPVRPAPTFKSFWLWLMQEFWFLTRIF